jgi:hypothetical protein
MLKFSVCLLLIFVSQFFKIKMDTIRRIGLKTLNFETFCQALSDETISLGAGSHTLSDLKRLSTKERGTLFEIFCRQYLLHKYNCSEAYLLADFPYKEEFGLRNQDMGIDIIARKNSQWIAVQCKFRAYQYSGASSTNEYVTWRDLSTFLSLCQRSGPYSQHLVMTSCKGVRRVGGMQEKDRSICRGTFEGLKREDWYEILECRGNKLSEDIEKLSLEEVRAKRLAILTK